MSPVWKRTMHDQPQNLSSAAKWQQNVNLAEMTTLNIGGNARYYAVPTCIEDIVSIYEYADNVSLPVYVLGNGSNLLIDDGGVDGIVIRLGSEFAYHSNTEDQITVGASLSMPKLARIALDLGSAGFEWMVGVPGTIGGGVAINASTTQQGTHENLVSVTYINPKGEIATEAADNLGLRYRGSALLDQGNIVLEASFRLDRSQPIEQVNERTQAYVKKRRVKFPLKLPNCGSVFKRPQGGKGPFTGQLIESVGLKGFQIGNAQISEMHANFIVNLGNASSQNVKDLIGVAQEKVQKEHQILLEREVRYFPEN